MGERERQSRGQDASTPFSAKEVLLNFDASASILAQRKYQNFGAQKAIEKERLGFPVEELGH